VVHSGCRDALVLLHFFEGSLSVSSFGSVWLGFMVVQVVFVVGLFDFFFFSSFFLERCLLFIGFDNWDCFMLDSGFSLCVEVAGFL